MRRIHCHRAAFVMAIIALSATFLSGADDRYTKRPLVPPETLPVPTGWTRQEPVHGGRPLSYWLKIVRQRNQELMPLAFGAIRDMGPEAWPAVPELTRVITAVFVPIHVGTDTDKQIASKIYDIQIRAEAIDALVFIGDAAASAIASLVQWALMPRLTPPATGLPEHHDLFIQLVLLDIAQRLQVVDAIVAFGDAATPKIEHLLRSPDAATRKFAVVILGEYAVLIAAELLKSPHCENRKLGITMLRDMDLIVAKEHLSGLSDMLVCDGH